MPIFEPVQPTVEDTIRQRFFLGEERGITLIKELIADAYHDVWNNSLGRSPPEVLAILGTKATRAFQLTAMFVAAVQFSDPAYTPPAIPVNPVTGSPWVVTPNADGTIILG